MTFDDKEDTKDSGEQLKPILTTIYTIGPIGLRLLHWKQGLR